MKPSTQKMAVIALVAGGVITFMGSLLLLGVVVVARIFYVDPYVIPQNGMYPNKPKYSRAIALRKPYDSVRQIERGDVVVFAQVKDGRNYKVLGRVIGLPGDEVQQIHTGELKVNGMILKLTKTREAGSFHIFVETNGGSDYEVAYEHKRLPLEEPPSPVVVGEGKLFCVGDNRDNSYDSRAYGPIPFSSIVGKVIW